VCQDVRQRHVIRLARYRILRLHEDPSIVLLGLGETCPGRGTPSGHPEKDPEAISTGLYYKYPQYRRGAYSASCGLGSAPPRLPQRTQPPRRFPLALRGKDILVKPKGESRCGVNTSEEVDENESEGEGEDSVGTERRCKSRCWDICDSGALVGESES
jgi:hypothetical protein